MEDTTPDFQDLLAAFDIPDMRVKISEVRSLAPVSSSSDVPKTTPSASTSSAPIVKQELGVSIPEPTWKSTGDDDASHQGQGSQVSDEDKLNPNVSVAATSTTQPESVNTNGSTVSNGDSGRNFFQSFRETDLVQRKVVSSTLLANSWAKSSGTPTVTIVSRPIRAQKAPPIVTSVQKLGRPASSISSIQFSKGSQKIVVANKNLVTNVRTVTMANSKQPLVVPLSKNSIPPLVFGRTGKKQVIVNVTSCNTGPKSTPAVVSSNPEKKAVKLSPESLLKRINPIPKYIPKAKQFLDWAQSRSPSQKKKSTQVTHPCDECGDIFICESSLKMHMERRSVQIFFSCIFCLGRCLMFYNKCSFFAHLRKHSQMMKVNMNYTSQIAKAKVSSLAIVNKEVVQVDKNKTVSLGNETTKSKDTDESTPNHLPSSDKEIEPLETTGDTQSSDAAPAKAQSAEMVFKCNVCLMPYKTMLGLQTHMQHRQAGVSKCNICKMDLPNNCQLRAHTTMHSETASSWVCPECSKVFTSLKLFSTHITNNCLHWYRQLRYECTLCSKFVVNYTDHLDKGHEMLFYRCVSCAMAFKTLQSLKEHSEQKHQVQPGSPLCRIISKCPFCETVFMQKPLLLAHIRAHISQNKQKSKYGYNCYVCNTVYANIVHFKKHFEKSHKFHKQFHCDYCRRRFLHYDDLLSHFKTGTPSGLSLSKPSGSDGVCKAASCKRFKNYVDHGKEAKTPESNSSASETSESSPSYSTTDAKHKEQALNKLYVKKTRSCPGCRKEGKVNYFQKETDLRAHMSEVHPQMKLSVINSEECVKYVTIKPKESKSSDPNNKEDKTNSNPDVDSRKRKNNSETDEDSSKQKRARTRIDLPTEFDCAKCDRHSTDRSEFKVHIEAHRPDRSFSQCEECGICFRIEVALRKHLFIKHGIREFKAYKLSLEGDTSCPTPDISITKIDVSVTDNEPVSTPTVLPSPKAGASSRATPLECKVCYKTFQQEATLRVHMRNHGMAFIRSKRSMSGD
ncbi:zinc finger protein 532-like isoform X2 [Asterias rubens]|nr:zinc finger protein 532-like isoform X2 [Asterias rubens]